MEIAIFDGIGNILRSDACGCGNFLADGGRQTCFKIESEFVEEVRSTKWTTFASEPLLKFVDIFSERILFEFARI